MLCVCVVAKFSRLLKALHNIVALQVGCDTTVCKAKQQLVTYLHVTQSYLSCAASKNPEGQIIFTYVVWIQQHQGRMVDVASKTHQRSQPYICSGKAQ